MTRKIIIGALVLVAFVTIIFLGANSYREKIKKDNIVIAREKVKTANINHELNLLNEAKELLENVDGEEKEELMKTIEEIEKDIAKDRVLNKYIDKINKLNKDYSEEGYEALKEEIMNIEDEDVKKELLDKLNNPNNEEEKEEKTEDIKDSEDKKTEEKKSNGKEEILESLSGNIIGYSPSSSDFLANGYYVGNGKSSYKDPTYGDVFIVAGDSSYPFGTIVKIKNLEMFELQDVYAIVLDRKDNVGKEKDSLFALLFDNSTEAKGFGLVKNVSCDIVRLGF